MGQKNRDWARALQALGMLMQTPANFQRIQRQQGLQAEEDAFNKAKRVEFMRGIGKQKALEFDVRDLTTPRPDFLFKGSRESAQRGMAQSILGKVDPKALAKSYLQPQKQTFSIPFEGKTFSFTDPNKYLTAMGKVKDLQKPDKDTYRITLKSGKKMNVNQATYIDYIQETGDFAPTKKLSPKQIISNAMNAAELESRGMGYKELTDMNAEDQIKLIQSKGVESVGESEWMRAVGKRSAITINPKGFVSKKVIFIPEGKEIETIKNVVLPQLGSDDQAEINEAIALHKSNPENMSLSDLINFIQEVAND